MTDIPRGIKKKGHTALAMEGRAIINRILTVTDEAATSNMTEGREKNVLAGSPGSHFGKNVFMTEVIITRH